MTPGDLATVDRSWIDLVERRGELLDALNAWFTAAGVAMPASRAIWLVDAVARLVGVLSSPSVLAGRAPGLLACWPDPAARPSYAVDGRAWMAAARECVPSWSEDVEASWKQGWLLLSEVLAAETLSPFHDA